MHSSQLTVAEDQTRRQSWIKGLPDCARHALRPLSDESVDAVMSRVRQLDRVADVRELLAPFED